MSASEEVAAADRSVVTVWSDIGCPWATLALHTLRAAARRRDRAVDIDHRAFPLELFNRMPTPKPILDAEIVTIVGLRPELGWRPWAEPDSTYPVTMLPALEAVQAAKSPEVGGLVASDQLDEALRMAFYGAGRCISIPSVILDVAANCADLKADALAEAMAGGAGRTEVYRQWTVAGGPEVQGSPHLFADGWSEHNPGAVYHWTARPPDGGVPRLDSYTENWAEELLDRMQE